MAPKIAIAGINGSLGTPLVDALTSTTFKSNYQFPIHALSRDASSKSDSDVLKHFSTPDYSDSESMKKALAGVDVLIDITSVQSDRKSLYKAAADNGVKLLIPGTYGNDYKQSEFAKVFDASSPVPAARELGLKVLEFKVGFLVRWNINAPMIIGVNPKEKTAERYGGGDFGINFTTEDDLTKAIASLAHRDPASLPDVVKFSSDRLTPNDVFATYEKLSGNKLAITDTLSKEGMLQKGRDIVTDMKKKVAENPDYRPPFPDFITILKAVTLEAKTFTFDQDDRELVNPGLWTWKSFEEVASEYWGSN